MICAVLLFVSINIFSQKQQPQFFPVQHASFVIKIAGMTIMVDPVGDEADYAGFGVPDVILITHEHIDHFDPVLLHKLKAKKTTVICTALVSQKAGLGTVLRNGEEKQVGQLRIQAIPAYNTTPERSKFHPKGVGNGYVLIIGGNRIYISGDTEDIADMRVLKNIDYAFVCMNLPYTMSVNQAASAIRAFKPKVVFPYHYRNQDGTMSDVGLLQKLLKPEENIRVELLKWYK